MKAIWTKERCHEEALKYRTRGDFCIGSPSSYGRSLKSKWIDEICTHMYETKKPKGYWTKERCVEEAIKYKTRSEFNSKSVSAYSKSWENDWLDEICSHMNYSGHRYSRCIYAYEFSDKFVYVGLTFNLNERDNQHKKKGPVFNHINKTSLIPNFHKLTDFIDIESAKLKEKEYVIFYKENGWCLLNSIKTGALGSSERKWTKEKCQEEALKYLTIKDYKKNSLSYRAAVRNKWLDEICNHMNRTKNRFGYWTKERCIEEALIYKTKTEFRNNFPGAYSACLNNGWIEEVSKHMKSRISKEKGHWTKERCQEEAFKYKTKAEFRTLSLSAYQTSLRNKWLDEMCLHMPPFRKENWTKERCIEEALIYKTKGEFRKNSPSAYERSRVNGWLNELAFNL